MVHITSFAIMAAALASQALAVTVCEPNKFYCGYTLLSGSDYNTWKPRIDAALSRSNQPVDGDHEYQSLFTCITPTTLNWDDYCLAHPLLRCQPLTNAGCFGTNDCCAPS
ncbi:hypothetical protein B0H66DRAFT_597526 [Apodospora peruviana]|uniref:Uncharacterized protein n=1 Tax=Apodospora peruviana TaxID=516989 RepID=A0AAE0MEY5_9PEZI|nr:hypothetical protein B0H66DRAFT_597526 [Apodospora peruviana]